jgi:hypothetical protein
MIGLPVAEPRAARPGRGTSLTRTPIRFENQSKCDTLAEGAVKIEARSNGV